MSKKDDTSNDLDMDDMLESDVSKGLLGDTFKKLFTAGATAAFLTEEGIKNYLGDIKLPKDLMAKLLQGATKSKEEITGRVSREIISIINQIDFVKEASRFVEEHKFKVTAEIEVSRKDKKEAD